AFLRRQGVKRGDVVSILAQNRPEMLAAHYAVPFVGAVLNTINTRLDADTIAYILDHSECVLFIADEASRERAERALALRDGNLALHVLAEPGQASIAANVLDLFDGNAEAAILEEAADIADEWQ